MRVYLMYQCIIDYQHVNIPSNNIPTTPSNHKSMCICDDRRKHRKTINSSIVDSGATVHCINDASLFDTIYENHPPVNVFVANKQKLAIQAVGTVKITLTSTNGKARNYILHNVVYHPLFSENLISVRRLWKYSRISSHFADPNRTLKTTTLTKNSTSTTPTRVTNSTPLLSAPYLTISYTNALATVVNAVYTNYVTVAKTFLDLTLNLSNMTPSNAMDAKREV